MVSLRINSSKVASNKVPSNTVVDLSRTLVDLKDRIIKVNNSDNLKVVRSSLVVHTNKALADLEGTISKVTSLDSLEGSVVQVDVARNLEDQVQWEVLEGLEGLVVLVSMEVKASEMEVTKVVLVDGKSL